MRTRLCVVLLGIAVSVTSLSAQGAAGQKPATVAIIGCLQSNAQKVFTLKDNRSGVTYRIDADSETIGWHVGHELEIHGPVEVRTDGLTVKPDQIIFVATRCST